MPPPLARAFTVDHIAALDDEAIEAFVAPLARDAGESERIGVALRGPRHDGLAARIARTLDAPHAAALRHARESGPSAVEGNVTRARRRLVGRLFWPLLYWHAPALYDDLITGEELHPEILDELHLDGRDVADLGCGTGRFTLLAATRARSVVAVDAAPPLLDRLRSRLADLGADTVEVRRGSFSRLPIADASVDVAVACSSLGARPPFGGEPELAEILRILRPGGLCAVIWPDEPAWFTARGMTHVALPGPLLHRFSDVRMARRLCRFFHGPEAARWVVEHGTADVPYEVLGMRPPADLCVMRCPGGDPDVTSVSALGRRRTS